MAQANEPRVFFWLNPGTPRTAAGGLRQAGHDGILPPDDYLQIISGCKTCGNPSACRTWQVANDMPADTCRNASVISELRAC
jgi:hypothetical protein